MKPLEEGLLLHVGLPKTGTTTLQETLFAKHPQVHYLGKNIHGPVARGCQSPEIFQVLKPALWGGPLSGRLKCARKVYADKLYPFFAADKFLLGSWEGLALSPAPKFARMLGRLVDIFGSCRILFVLRNPLTQVPSEYLQNLRGHFIQKSYRWMGLPPYIDIDTWFARRVRGRKDAHDVLTYAKNIRTSIEMLGADRVGIFLFEDMLNDPDRYYRAVSNFIGIDGELALALIRDEHLHKRISQGQVDWLKTMEGAPLKGLSLQLKSRAERRKLFDQHADEGSPAKTVLSEGLAREVSALTRPGNRWLVEECGLPLQKYGYPL